jgi:lipoprotein NlpI
MRGHVYFDLGRFAEASSDFATAVTLDPGYPYSAIWLFLARSRAGEDGRSELAANSARFDLRKWPGPIILMYLGQLEPGDLQSTSRDRMVQLGESCEAAFYRAELYLIQGDKDRAAADFKATIATGVTEFTEYAAATKELKALGE